MDFQDNKENRSSLNLQEYKLQLQNSLSDFEVKKNLS